MNKNSDSEIKYISKTTYYIQKMDCLAEEQMIRVALSDITSILLLEFDLNNRNLIVWHTIDVENISDKLYGLNLGASLLSSISEPETHIPSKDAIEFESDQAKALWILLSINAVMFIIEFISGWLFESTGLIADSLDMFADAAVYGISLFAVGKATQYKLKAAYISGWFQLSLALGAFFEVGRRFLYGSEPEPTYMIGVAVIALIANVLCLWFIAKHRDSGAHMKASWIFSANDVIANLGVIIAGILVYFTSSRFPDLVIGTVIGVIVFIGSVRILKLK